MPSQAEGYGHSINEARGKGQIVLTLDAEPMGGLVNDGVDGYKVGSKQVGQFSSGAPQYGFDQDELAEKVRKMSKMTDIERGKVSSAARQSFEADRDLFFKQFGEKTDALMAKRIQERSLMPAEDENTPCDGNAALCWTSTRLTKNNTVGLTMKVPIISFLFATTSNL